MVDLPCHHILDAEWVGMIILYVMLVLLVRLDIVALPSDQMQSDQMDNERVETHNNKRPNITKGLYPTNRHMVQFT
jgi:hypothetical protein